MLHTRETILKPCTFFQFGKVPCNLFVTPSYVSTWTNFSSKKYTNLSTMSLRFFVLLFCTFKSIEALVKCNGIVNKLQICSLDDTYDHGRFMQGLLEFILTEGYSGGSSNPGLTSVTQKNVPSAVVIHYCAWYVSFRYFSTVSKI